MFWKTTRKRERFLQSPKKFNCSAEKQQKECELILLNASNVTQIFWKKLSHVMNLEFLNAIQKQKAKFGVAHNKFSKTEKSVNKQSKNQMHAYLLYGQ